MWTYILRRFLVMIPTLFGVTIVAFAVMQLAPGDPMDNLGSAGAQQSEGESRDTYLIRKRDMKLDKPWFLNFNYFRNDYYKSGTLAAARILSMTTDQVEAMLERLAGPTESSKKEKADKAKPAADSPPQPTDEDRANLEFIEGLDIEDFNERLMKGSKQRARLAQAIRGSATNVALGGGLTRKWCEDAGIHGAAAALAIIKSDKHPLLVKVGALQALDHMVTEPIQYTYSRDASNSHNVAKKETSMVLGVWRLWWKRNQADFPELTPERRTQVEKRFDRLVEYESRGDLIQKLDYLDPKEKTRFDTTDMRVFIERLLADGATLKQRIVASMGLKLYVGRILPMMVPKSTIETIAAAEAALKNEESDATETTDAATSTNDESSNETDDEASDTTNEETAAGEEEGEGEEEEEEVEKTPAEQLAEAAKEIERIRENCQLSYDENLETYQPGFGKKCWYIVADTQYAHMVGKLVTFRFGRSTLRTREPVGENIWRAFLVTAPLMICAQLVIYLVAVPLGIVCAVNRGTLIDRLISLKLFLLYSIPPFIAAMLFLLFFCYGRIGVSWMPTVGLHGETAADMGFFSWLFDYIWHATLPIICLSLFSLAGMAMFSRASMLEVIGQDYIRTARAKGLPEDKVIFKHTFRNAMIPLITLFAGFLPAMLGGSVLIESLFNIPGMGKLGLDSIEQKDYPTLMAILYINAIIVMISILITDLLYVFVDPRISFESKDGG